MSIFPDDYVKYVLDDLKENAAKRKVVKASFFECKFKNLLPPDQIHPNPEDEFSMPEVGPSFQIVGKYVDEAKNLTAFGETVFEEPVIVEKLSPSGYLLLNGHHRWFAARRFGVPKLHVKVTNLTHREQIVKVLEETKNIKRVAFDLEEVLLVGPGCSEEKLKDPVGGMFIKQRLRKGTAKLIKELQSMDFDVWIYTSSYMPREFAHYLFNLYGLSIRGCINATGRIRSEGEKKENTKKIFSEHYRLSTNIDNKGILYVNHETHDFEQHELSYQEPDDWADNVISVLHETMPAL